MPYRSSLLILLGATILVPLSAKNKKPKPQPKDEIQVVAHIPLTNGPVKRFFSTEHYSSYYVYAEHANGGNLTLIDVSKTTQPKVLAEVAYGSAPDQGLSLVAGTAAMVTNEPVAAAPPAPHSVKIMDFSDPVNPKVAREFTGVTAISRDDRRGVIFIANGEGIWILQQHLAEDPQVEKAYANQVIYGMSMYPRK